MRLLIDKDQQYDTDYHAADDRQRDHTCSQNDTNGDGPEQERNIQRLLNGSAETDDGQSTHHTERKHYIGGNCQNHDGGDHGKRNERRSKTGRIHHALIGLFIYEKDKQAKPKCKDQSNGHIQNGHRGHIFQKLDLKTP